MGYTQRWGTDRDGVHTEMGLIQTWRYIQRWRYIQIWGTYRDGVHTEIVYIQRWG